MGTKIPANLITTGYTSGKEFVYVSNYKPYQGYYYEINNKFFVGKGSIAGRDSCYFFNILS
jgi:hypothetical protein